MTYDRHSGKLGWKILEIRRSKIRLAMFYKILNNLIAIQRTQIIIKTNASRKKSSYPNHPPVPSKALLLLPLQFLPLHHLAVECHAKHPS